MERWSGVIKVPVSCNNACFRVAASLCLSPTSKTLIVPSANVIFFNGDRVDGTGNPVIERLSDIHKIAEILVAKYSCPINAWSVEASTYNGPFAVYKEFIPSVNSWGEPKSYNPMRFPAATSTLSLLSHCLQEAKDIISGNQEKDYAATPSTSQSYQPKTFLFGFSKGGIVLNQLVTELGYMDEKSMGSSARTGEQLMVGEHPKNEEDRQIIPNSKESLLNSIAEIHYVDVGLNSAGAYLTDGNVIENISKRLVERSSTIRFVLHGTPRQWCDIRRVLIREEKDKLVELLQFEAERSGGKLQVSEKFYFADTPPNLQMHFEIIDNLDVS